MTIRWVAAKWWALAAAASLASAACATLLDGGAGPAQGGSSPDASASTSGPFCERARNAGASFCDDFDDLDKSSLSSDWVSLYGRPTELLFDAAFSPPRGLRMPLVLPDGGAGRHGVDRLVRFPVTATSWELVARVRVVAPHDAPAVGFVLDRSVSGPSCYVGALPNGQTTQYCPTGAWTALSFPPFPPAEWVSVSFRVERRVGLLKTRLVTSTGADLVQDLPISAGADASPDVNTENWYVSLGWNGRSSTGILDFDDVAVFVR